MAPFVTAIRPGMPRQYIMIKSWRLLDASRFLSWP
jgi:hypothetical protein